MTVNGGTLTLSGGNYYFSSLSLSNSAHVVANALSSVWVTSNASLASGTTIAPASGLSAKDLTLNYEPAPYAGLAIASTVQAIVVASNANVTISGPFTGALAAAQLTVSSGVTVTCQDGLVPLPPPLPGDAGIDSGICACDDGNPCTVDTCYAGTCAHVAGANGTACDDGNVCTEADSCYDGMCLGGPPSPTGTACDDGNICTHDDTCTSGTCAGLPCAPIDACNTASCDPSTGACSSTRISLPPTVVSDCTLITCDPVHGPRSFTSCPPVDPTVPSTVMATTSFLYEGTGPLQQGVTSGTIVATRAAAIRGMVYDATGAGIHGVTVAILSHPEYGYTTTLTDGSFTMVVNGGSALTVTYSAAGLLPVQRTITSVPWNGYAKAADVTMTALDTKSTVVTLGGGAYQVAQGSTVTDSRTDATPDGGVTTYTRTATLLIPTGTTANIVPVTGSPTAASSLTIRATEFTVGASGPSAMPGALPPASAYTYAVEFSADEATNGASVEFSQPIISYTDNVLHFGVGQSVPVGYYDRTQGVWVPSPDGLVIGIVSITGGSANIDIDGDGVADSSTALEAVGITSAEQTQLASLYTAGTSLWRVSIPHFTPWDFNWPFAPPSDAVANTSGPAGPLMSVNNSPPRSAPPTVRSSNARTAFSTNRSRSRARRIR